MSGRVTISVGPLPSSLLLEWLDHNRALVTAVRRERGPLSITVHDDMLELIEALFDVWESLARASEVFSWSAETGTEQVEALVAQWIEIGALRDDELERLGCSWAPPHTRAVADAMVAGATAALAAVGPRGADLAARLAEG